MPRLPRFFAPGVPLHLIQRGNDRQVIFSSPEDHLFFRETLKSAIRRHSVWIHAYVLMTNHIHLLATPSARSSIPKAMQAVGRVYVQYFNARYRRTGTLWEGRYKAAVVEDERYLLICMRYIELNPVRARMVAGPGDYRWSSFRANACGTPDDLVTPHPIYRTLGITLPEQQEAYRELFRTAVSVDDLCLIRDATQHAWALGGASFRKRITELGRRAERLPMGRPARLSAAVEKSRV